MQTETKENSFELSERHAMLAGAAAWVGKYALNRSLPDSTMQPPTFVHVRAMETEPLRMPNWRSITEAVQIEQKRIPPDQKPSISSIAIEGIWFGIAITAFHIGTQNLKALLSNIIPKKKILHGSGEVPESEAFTWAIAKFPESFSPRSRKLSTQAAQVLYSMVLLPSVSHVLFRFLPDAIFSPYSRSLEMGVLSGCAAVAGVLYGLSRLRPKVFQEYDRMQAAGRRVLDEVAQVLVGVAAQFGYWYIYQMQGWEASLGVHFVCRLLPTIADQLSSNSYGESLAKHFLHYGVPTQIFQRTSNADLRKKEVFLTREQASEFNLDLLAVLEGSASKRKMKDSFGHSEESHLPFMAIIWRLTDPRPLHQREKESALHILATCRDLVEQEDPSEENKKILVALGACLEHLHDGYPPKFPYDVS